MAALRTGLQHQRQSHGVVASSSRRSSVSHARRVVRLAAAADTTVAKVDPFATKTVRKDTWFDKLFIKIYSKKMADQLTGVPVPDEPEFDDFVRISKEIMRGRTPTQQMEVVSRVLGSLLPPGAPEQFRRLFPPTQLSAELNAWFATLGFGWLVGEMELQTGDLEVAPGVFRRQKSIVKIKKCRYLEGSACVGTCVNMCKIPTETFFTESFGLPLYMKPNFEDLSCEMKFGEAPKPKHLDPAFAQPCFKPECSVGELPQPPKPCYKLRA